MSAKSASMTGASAPPTSSSPLSTTWTTVMSDGGATGPPLASTARSGAPPFRRVPLLRAGRTAMWRKTRRR
eukprot:12927138-Prorocentrum_lima.AAC.1